MLEQELAQITDQSADPTIADTGELSPIVDQQGFDVWFGIFDPSGELRHDGLVTLRWGADGQARGTPREEDGVIWIPGIPRGTVFVEASCPGLATHRFEYLVPVEPLRIQRIVLERSAALIGKVGRADGPVGGCAVYCWLDENEGSAFSVEVGEADEGRFAFDAVPVGQVRVTAVSPQWGQSEIVAVEVRTEEVAEVDLELPGNKYVTGLVLDRETGQPLSGSQARLVVSTSTVEIAEVAAGFADVDGRFFLPGSSSHGSAVVVSAPGYSSQTKEIHGEELAIDVGTIVLHRSQPLTICIVSDGTLTTSGYQVSSLDGQVPVSRFGEDGCLTVEGVAAELLEFLIRPPDESYLRVSTYLQPRRDWRIEVPVQGYGTAHVQFGDSVVIEGKGRLSLTYELVPGVFCDHRFELDRPKPLTVDGVPPGTVTATLYVDDVPQGSDTSLIEGKGTVDLFIGGDLERLRVRVIDGAGMPIEGAEVSVVTPGSGVGAEIQMTDPLGVCSFPRSAAGEHFAMIIHPTKGIRVGVPLASTNEDVLDIMLQADSSLEVVFRSDDGNPLGVSCTLADPVSTFVATDFEDADAAGLVDWERLHRGSYLMQMRHPSFFPLNATIDVSGATRREFVLRGRGALALLAVDAEGTPLAGVPIGLVSLADDVNVEHWAARTWIDLPPQGLVTDALGRLTLAGLASGPYEWSAGGRSGQTMVRAGDTTESRIVLE